MLLVTLILPTRRPLHRNCRNIPVLLSFLVQLFWMFSQEALFGQTNRHLGPKVVDFQHYKISNCSRLITLIVKLLKKMKSLFRQFFLASAKISIVFSGQR